jgi:hypothetical protein
MVRRISSALSFLVLRCVSCFSPSTNCSIMFSISLEILREFSPETRHTNLLK